MPGDTSGTARRRLIRIAIGIPTVVATTVGALAVLIWAPPLFSGAIFLLSPAGGVTEAWLGFYYVAGTASLFAQMASSTGNARGAVGLTDR